MEEFARDLKRKGKKEHVVAGLVDQVKEFGRFLAEQGRGLDAATCEDLESYADRLESKRKGRARTAVRGVGLYYRFVGREELGSCAAAIREAGIARRRRSLSLRELPGLDERDVDRLADAGIRDAEQMMAAGQTPTQRQSLSARTGVPLETIVELVSLADLTRIRGVAGIRARLYHDAGVDTLAKLAAWEPEALRQMLVGFVDRTGFDGIAPLPKEAKFTVAEAKRLPQLVEW
jgi:hypothetical protein